VLEVKCAPIFITQWLCCVIKLVKL